MRNTIIAIIAALATACAVDLETSSTEQHSSACTMTRTWVACGQPHDIIWDGLCVITCSTSSHCGDCQWIPELGLWLDEESTAFGCPQLAPPPIGTGLHRGYCQRDPLITVPDELKLAPEPAGDPSFVCGTPCVSDFDCQVQGPTTCRRCNSGGCNSWVP